MPAFELVKWYADCVTDEGDAAIVYHAAMRWLGVTLHYSSMLTHKSGCPVQCRYSLRKREAPAIKDGEIRWRSQDWQAAGVWRELGNGRRNVLFASEAGSLDWNCVAPRARVTFQAGSRQALEGWGYAEHLRLTLPPWQLPIRRLRWGRFVNAADALVWIDWMGGYNKRVTYLNGAEVSATEIGDNKIVLADEGGVLSLDSACILREGVLGSTALAIIPNLGRLFPDSILNMSECKGLSRAVLRRPGQADSMGLAIHEVVEWP
jgi:hypothetical protein